jgi:hypothetical protein
MALRRRYRYTSKFSVGYSIERFDEGTYFDFSTLAFGASPTMLIAALLEDAGCIGCLYKSNLMPSLLVRFTDCDDFIIDGKLVASNVVVRELVGGGHAGDNRAMIAAESATSVAAVVTAGLNADNNEFSRSRAGFDAVQIEGAFRVRQAV